MRFKIDWSSLINGRRFTVFALYLRAISEYKPPGGLIFGGCFALPVFFFFFWGGGGLYLEGLIHGRAYFRNFTVVL